MYLGAKNRVWKLRFGMTGNACFKHFDGMFYIELYSKDSPTTRDNVDILTHCYVFLSSSVGRLDLKK